MLQLSITGFDADPDDVTRILGLMPTSVGRRGDPRASGRPRDFNGWWLELHAPPLGDGAAHHSAIEALVAQLQGKEARFAELRERVHPKSIDIYGGIYHGDEQCGVWLEPAQMAVLAGCGIGWGLDIFLDTRTACPRTA
jgi:hypothetical protein